MHHATPDSGALLPVQPRRIKQQSQIASFVFMDSSTPFPHCLIKLLGPIEMGEVVETDVVDLPIVVDPSSEILDRLG